MKCPADEIFYGGARGGGKTDGMLGKFAVKASLYGENCIGVFFRRSREDLKEAIERSRTIYGPIGAKWHEQKKWWVFPNGARLKFEYLDRDQDADNYQGHGYTDVFFEELTHWADPKPVNKLRATLRSADGVPCQFHATGNPGGPGHQWVKARYIDPAPLGWKVLWEDFTNPFTGEAVRKNRIYIPSKISDNSYLGNDYIANLYQSGSSELVRAWLDGDWSVIEGAFFDCWSNEKHVLAPFAIPADWTRFRSIDWGSAAPFSVGWWAVVGDDYALGDQDGSARSKYYGDMERKNILERERRSLPRGALVRYREWYGASAPNVGLKLTAEEVAAGILSRSDTEKIAYTVCDPSMFKQDGGPSHAERMMKAGVTGLRPGDNARVSQKGAMGGWDMMRARMKGDGERPMMYVFSTCKDFIRTVPALQHDQTKPEDVDTASEDHCFTKDTLVRTSKGLYPIADLIGTSGFVQSHDGDWHRYRSARLVKRNQRIVRLAISDGSAVECTADHKFLTTAGWLEAAELPGLMILSLSARPPKSLTAFATICAAGISRIKAGGFIGAFGKRLAVQFQTVATFITRMMTAAITHSTIWNVCLFKNTLATGMARPVPSAASYTLNARWPELGNGTPARLGLNGTASNTQNIALLPLAERKSFNADNAMLNLKLRTESFVRINASLHGDALAGLTTNLETALSVADDSWSTNTPNREIAREFAVQLPAHAEELVCLSLSEAGYADVYCLTVPDTGNFVLANGAIVANCADEARYGLMSRPWIPVKAEAKKPNRLVYEAKPDGRIVANMSVKQIVEMKMRRKKFGADER